MFFGTILSVSFRKAVFSVLHRRELQIMYLNEHLYNKWITIYTYDSASWIFFFLTLIYF